MEAETAATGSEDPTAVLITSFAWQDIFLEINISVRVYAGCESFAGVAQSGGRRQGRTYGIDDLRNVVLFKKRVEVQIGSVCTEK